MVKSSFATVAVVLSVTTTSTNAFIAPKAASAETYEKTSQRLQSTTSSDRVTSSREENQMPSSSQLSKYSQSIPFLERPAALKGELAGDVGFDPLGFAKNREQLWVYREAEIKHARLAMLAAAGWPLSELWDSKIAAYLNLDPIVDETNRAPSLLNGHMDNIVPEWWGFCLGLTAAVDLYGVEKARSGDPAYVPGDLGFDPLKLYPEDTDGRQRMQLAEIKHGRLAMLAVTGFSAQEAISKQGVVDETPFFFMPLSVTMRNMFGGFLAAGLTEEFVYDSSGSIENVLN